MLSALAKLFGFKKQEEKQPEAVPYKVETPAEESKPVSVRAAEVMVESVSPAKTAKAKKTGAEKKPRAPRKPKASKA